MGKEVPQDAVNEMLANYVLPTSNDMPGSSEVFDEVIFTELGRVEAQKHLDEMKSQLKSPSNLNTRTNFSRYSCERSVQSLSSREATDKEAASAVGGHEVYSQRAAFFDRPDNLNPLQVNPAYTSHGSFVQQQGRLAESNLSLLNNSPYGHYSNGVANVFRTDRFDPYQRSRDSSPYKNASDRSFSSIADASSPQSCRATENSRRLSFESPSSLGRAGYGHQLDRPLYNSPGVHLHDPRVLQAPQDGFRRSSIESPSYPFNPPSYSSPSAHLHMPRVPPLEHYASRTPPNEWCSPHQTTYGSPYAYPVPRPPSGTPPPTALVNRPYGSWHR